MDKLQTILSNDKVILTPLRYEDESLLQPIAAEKELWTYGLQDLSQPGELTNYIKEAIIAHEAGTCAIWLVTDAAIGRVAGCTRLFAIDWKNRRGEIGATWLGAPYRGTGLNQAMKYLILQYGFETLNLNRIELKADERNMRSRKAIAGIGAVEEGTLRQHMITHDGYIRNTVYYSILQSEWQQVRTEHFTDYLI